MNNFRNALRQLIKQPWYSFLVVLMLALGIGATTAMFSMFHTILLKPLPVSDADRLVNLGAPGPKPGGNSCNIAGPCNLVFSYPMFRDLESKQDVLSGIAGHLSFYANLTTGNSTTMTAGMFVSGQYFHVLGLQPALGRLLSPHDDVITADSAVAVLSYNSWQRQFNGDAGVIGSNIIINGQTFTIVGVAPQGFSGTTLGRPANIFVPLTMYWHLTNYATPDITENRKLYWVYLFGRLKDGDTPEHASAGLNVLYSSILNEIEVPLNSDLTPQVLAQFRERKITMEPGSLGQSNVRINSRQPLILSLIITSLVLLIACINITGLLLARSTARTGEIAIRTSLGATRIQLVYQFLSEYALLGILGGILSIPVAVITLRSVIAMIPATISVSSVSFSIDATAMLFAAGMSLITLLVFGLTPAFRGISNNPSMATRSHAAGMIGGSGIQRSRRLLATVQIALSLVLLVLAGLCTKSLVKVVQEDLGSRVESIIAFTVSPGRNGYGTERILNLYQQIERQLLAEPAITDVATSAVRILNGDGWWLELSVEDFESRPDENTIVGSNYISPGFFDTFSVPLLAGRDFTSLDRDGSQRVAIVNEAFLKKFGFDMDAIGKRLAIQASVSELDIEIIGVIADAKYSEVKGTVPAQVFLPRLQYPDLGRMTFYISTAFEPEIIMERIRPIVTGIDSNLPVEELLPMEQVIIENMFLERMMSVIAASFAGLAALLAAIGVYGILAYSVAQRTRELGLRLALGSTPAGLKRLILVQVGHMLMVGVPFGLIMAIVLGRGAESLLYGVTGYDPVVLILAIVLIGIVGLPAGLIPALAASRIDPMQALREE